MSSVSLDTNILLRWLLRDVPAQAKRADALISSGRSLVVADIAVSELAYVLEKVAGMPRNLVAENVNAILSQAKISCNRALFQKTLALYVTSPALSFNDCYLAAHAQLNNAVPLYTFDKKLAAQAADTMLLV